MYTIRMAHPGKNALSTDLMGWLDGELDRAGSEPILLTGSGDAFCAGLNLKEVASLDAAGIERFVRHIDHIAARLFDHPAPVVAALNGHAIAGGAVLAACCDWRVATSDPKARIGVNEIALGVCFPPAIFRIMAHRISPQHQNGVLLGARLYDSAAALTVGLVDELATDVEAVATQKLTAFAAHPRDAYAHAKALLRAGVTRVSAADEARFRERELPIWTSDAVRQRVLAVLKR